MIVDRFEQWTRYFAAPQLAGAFEFLSRLGPDAPDGDYPLSGGGLFARVVSYETRPPNRAVLEAHRAHADLQAVLAGTEALEWFPARGLETSTPYDPDKDVEFFHRPGSGAARVVLTPGLFAALFPWDAHMPQLAVASAAAAVRKVVVKVPLGLFGRQLG